MSNQQQSAQSGVDEPGDYVARYLRDGYAVVRGLFSRTEIDAISAAADQLHAEGVRYGRSFRHGNLFYNVAPGDGGEPLVRMVQWPENNGAYGASEKHPRQLRTLQPLERRLHVPPPAF